MYVLNNNNIYIQYINKLIVTQLHIYALCIIALCKLCVYNIAKSDTYFVGYMYIDYVEIKNMCRGLYNSSYIIISQKIIA